jgi:hypothetical protein
MYTIHYLSLGHPEYGCFISQEKTLTNFDHGDQVHNVVDPGQRSEASPSSWRVSLTPTPTQLSLGVDILLICKTYR